MYRASIFEPFREGQYIKCLTPWDASGSVPSVFDYIEYEFNEEAVWDAFLMHISWRFMPMSWHGAYAKRKYIFTMEDAANIIKTYKTPFVFALSCKRFSLANFGIFVGKLNYYLTKCSILPSIKLLSDNEAQVTIAYWNDWAGLIRKTVKITKQAGTTTFEDIKVKRLIKYDCGTRY